MSSDLKVLSVSQAAKMLDVPAKAINRACQRWSLGIEVPVGSQQRMIRLLTEDDVTFINQHLQRRPGRPTCKPTTETKPTTT